MRHRTPIAILEGSRSADDFRFTRWLVRIKRQSIESSRRKPSVGLDNLDGLSLIFMDQQESKKIDSQQVELLGRNILISKLIADDIEIALPLRDRGVDLIAFADVNNENKFKAIPIQLKSSSKTSFSINRKYEKFSNLILAYIWYASDPQSAELYIMTYPQALTVANELGWTGKKSWIEGSAFSTSRPSKRIIELIEPYKYIQGSLACLVHGKI